MQDKVVVISKVSPGSPFGFGTLNGAGTASFCSPAKGIGVALVLLVIGVTSIFIAAMPSQPIRT
jgi:hypothetical protein